MPAIPPPTTQTSAVAWPFNGAKPSDICSDSHTDSFRPDVIPSDVMSFMQPLTCRISVKLGGEALAWKDPLFGAVTRPFMRLMRLCSRMTWVDRSAENGYGWRRGVPMTQQTD